MFHKIFGFIPEVYYFSSLLALRIRVCAPQISLILVFTYWNTTILCCCNNDVTSDRQLSINKQANDALHIRQETAFGSYRLYEINLIICCENGGRGIHPARQTFHSVLHEFGMQFIKTTFQWGTFLHTYAM
jgi:hypothetical protein